MTSSGPSLLEDMKNSSSSSSKSAMINLFRNQSNLGKDPKSQIYKEPWMGLITRWIYDLIQCRGQSLEQESFLTNQFHKHFVLGEDLEIEIEIEGNNTMDTEDDEKLKQPEVLKKRMTINMKDIDANEFIASIDIRLVILFLFFYSDFFSFEQKKKKNLVESMISISTNHQSEKSVVTDKEDDDSSDGDEDEVEDKDKEDTHNGLSFTSHSFEMSAIFNKLHSIYSSPFATIQPTRQPSSVSMSMTNSNNKLVLIKPALYFQAVNSMNLPSLYAFPRVVALQSLPAVKFFHTLLRIIGKSYLTAAAAATTTATQQHDSSLLFLIRWKDCHRFCNFLANVYLVAESGSELEWILLEILQDCISTPVVFAGFRSSPGVMVALLCQTIEKNLGKRRFVALDILRHYCSDPFILETLFDECNNEGDVDEEGERKGDTLSNIRKKEGENNESEDESESDRNFLLVLLDIIRQGEIFAKYRAWKILSVISTLRIKWLEKYSPFIMKEIELILNQNVNTNGTEEEHHQYSAEDDVEDYLHELPDLKQKMKKEIISLLVNIQMSDWFQRFIHYHDSMLPKVVQLLRDKDSDTCSAASLWLFNSLRVTSQDSITTIHHVHNGKQTSNKPNYSICSEAQLCKLKQYFDHKTKGNNPASFYSVSFPLLFQLSDDLQRIQRTSMSCSSMKGKGDMEVSSTSTHEYHERYRNYLFIISQKLMANNNTGFDSINSNGAFANRSIIDTHTVDRKDNEEKERKNAIRALCKMRLLPHCPWTIELFFEEDFELIESTLDAFQLLMNKTDPLNLLVLHGICTLLMDLLLVLENKGETFTSMVEDKFLISRLSLCGLVNLLINALSIVTFPPIVQLLLGMVGKLLKLESFRENLLLQGCQKVVKDNIIKLTKESVVRQVNESKCLPFEMEDDDATEKLEEDDVLDLDFKEVVAQAKRWDYNNQITNLWAVVQILVNFEVEGQLPSPPLNMNKRNQLIDKLEFLANNFSQMPTLLEHELLMTLQVFDLLLHGKISGTSNETSTTPESLYLTLMQRNCHLFVRIFEDLIRGIPIQGSGGMVETSTRWINNILLTHTIKKSLLLVSRIMCKIWDNQVICPDESNKQEWRILLQKLPLIAKRYFSSHSSNKDIDVDNDYSEMLNHGVTLSKLLQSN